MFKIGDKIRRLNKNPMHEYRINNDEGDTIVQPGNIVTISGVTPYPTPTEFNGYTPSEANYSFEEEGIDKSPHWCLVEENFECVFITWKERYKQ